MSDLVAHLHVKFCTINALLKHYVLIASRQCFNNVSVKCLGPFFFPYGVQTMYASSMLFTKMMCTPSNPSQVCSILNVFDGVLITWMR